MKSYFDAIQLLVCMVFLLPWIFRNLPRQLKVAQNGHDPKIVLAEFNDIQRQRERREGSIEDSD